MGASLEVMERDSRRMRGDRPFLFTNCMTGRNIDTLADYATHHPDAIRLCLELTSMFRKLERAGDHINNLAEETVFYIDAEVLKHRRAQRPEPEAE